MLDYARQAQSGRMHWSQVSADILYPDHPTDPAEVLANITMAKDASAALEGYNPPHKLYRELKKKLAELRGQGEGPVVQIADGPALKYTPARGKKQPEIVVEDPRVPQLRAKLGISENADDIRYDAKVAEAVRRFQDGADLKVTGVLDDRTVKAINSPKRDRAIDTVIVNMERWRWLPRQLGAPSLGNAYVILNIPDFTLKVMQNGGQVWTTRVVTGKPGNHATPLLTETMKFINRQSDLERAALDHLQRISAGTAAGPHGAATHGIAARARPRRQHPHFAAARRSQRARPHPLQLPEQVPGLSARHAGQAFVRQGRARVQPWLHAGAESGSIRRDPCSTSRCRTSAIRRRRSAACTATARSTSNSRRRSRSTSRTRRHSWTTPASCSCARTVYGRDAAMLAILRGAKGRDLENMVARSQPGYSRPAGSSLPSNVAFNSDFGNSGPSFFDRLFGPRTPPPPVRVQRPRRAVPR